MGSDGERGEASTSATRLPATGQSQTQISRLSVSGLPVAKASYRSAVPANAWTGWPPLGGAPGEGGGGLLAVVLGGVGLGGGGLASGGEGERGGQERGPGGVCHPPVQAEGTAGAKHSWYCFGPVGGSRDP